MDDLLQQEFYEGAGAVEGSDVVDLLKAFEANTAITDISNLTGMGALQPQSLEGTLVMLTGQEKHLTLWRDIPKGDAVSTLEEYSSILGAGSGDEGWVDQMEMPLESDPMLKRDFAIMKFIRSVWRVSDVAGMVKSIKDGEVLQKQMASLRILRRLNRALYSGDSSMISQSIDGFEKTIKSNGSAEHVIDLRGVAPTTENFRLAAELLTANFGNAQGAGLYVSPGGMTTIDQVMGSAVRIGQTQIGNSGQVSMGYATDRIHTSFGTMMPKVDLYIASEYEARTVPKVLNESTGNLVEGKTSSKAPNTPAITVAAATGVSGSKFASTGVRPAGVVYNYRAASGNRYGLSAACVAAYASGAVAAGGANNITITKDAGSTYAATYHEVYSEQVAASGDFRFLGRIADSGAATTIYTDKNLDIPGTTKMFLLDFTTIGEDRTYQFARLAPLFSQELAKIGPYRWGLVNLFGTPKYYAKKKFIMFKNVPITANTKSNLLEV